MPLSRQLVQIIGRNKFSIRFESLCWILRISSGIRMRQNQAKTNYKDCSFGNWDSFVKDTKLSVLILAKSQAGVTADLDPSRIWTPRSRSASGFGPPRSKSASGYGPPLVDLDPPENKRSIE